MIEQAPILVTGCARSGTSMIAKVINICGAFGGRMNAMYENKAIQEQMVKLYLGNLGYDSKGQYPMPTIEGLVSPFNWKMRVEDIMTKEGYQKGLWLLKDTKMCQMWPVWNNAFPNAKWIIVRRRTGDIVQSCLKTGYMTAFADEHVQKEIGVSNEQDGWLWWEHEHEKRFVEMITEGLNCKVIWPSRMVYGDYQQLYETLDWLKLPWRSEILSVIDPLLWNSRQKERSQL